MGASIIVVEVDATADEAYRRTAQIFQEYGFQIANSDPKLLQITTQPKGPSDFLGPVRDLTFSAQINGNGSSSIVRVSGQLYGSQEVQKKGQSGSPMRKAWKRMHKVATSLGTITTYEAGRDLS